MVKAVPDEKNRATNLAPAPPSRLLPFITQQNAAQIMRIKAAFWCGSSFCAR